MRIRINMAATAMLACFLIPNGVALAAPDSGGAAATANECLSAPKKSETPPGGHWYYRTDRTTKRKCWFLGEASSKASRSAARTATKTAAAKPSRSEAADPDAARKKADPAPKNSPQSFDDARAEMTGAEPTSDDDKLQASVWPPMNDSSDAKAVTADAGNAAPATQQIAQSTFSQDRFAPAPTANAASPVPSAAPQPDRQQPASTSNASNAESGKATQPPTATPPLPSPAPASDTRSLRPMLAALACGLGLAIILGGFAFKQIERRREGIRLADGGVSRRDIWSDVPADEMPRSTAAAPTPVDLDEAARRTPEREDTNDEVSEPLVAQPSRRTAA